MRLKPARPDMPRPFRMGSRGLWKARNRRPQGAYGKSRLCADPWGEKRSKKNSSILCSFCRPSAAISTPAANADLQGEGVR